MRILQFNYWRKCDVMRESSPVATWISFPHIETAQELEQYLEERPKGHTRYYHYTSLAAINAILQGEFCISSIDRFNDQTEKAAFEGFEKKYYSLCFSTGVQENLALWYLYSGVDGKGGRLQFTYKSIEKLLQSTFALVEYDYDSHTVIREIATLTDENASRKFGDVMYADASKSKKGFMDMKYNTMTNREIFSVEQWECHRTKHRGFQKSHIWYYEKETRLLIELSDTIYNSLDLTKNYCVILKIPKEVLRYTKVRFAPKIQSLDAEEIEKQPNIEKLKKYKSRLQLSDHKGRVDIDLCKNCRRHNVSIRTSRMTIRPEFEMKDGFPQLNQSNDTVPDIINLPPCKRNAFVGYLPNTATEVCHVSLECLDGKYEIHYGTEAIYQGKRYLSEALPVVISWLFTNTKIESLYARIGDNPPSKHLLIKNGFVKSEENYPKDGTLYKLEKG